LKVCEPLLPMNRKSRSRRPRQPRKHKQTGKEIANALAGIKPMEVFRSWRNTIPTYPRAPRGPVAGAALSTKQIVYSFTQSSGLTAASGTTTVSASGSATTQWSLGFTIADLPQVASFATIFDQYRIDKVVVRIMSRNNAVSMVNLTSPNLVNPLHAIVVDRDDISVLGSYQAVVQYDNCQVIQGDTSMDIELKPSITPAAYSSGAFSGYVIQDTDAWIDFANTSVLYYGIKGAITQLTASSAQNWVWDINAAYYVSFRKVR